MKKLFCLLSFVPMLCLGTFEYEGFQVDSARQYYYLSFDVLNATPVMAPRFYLNSYDSLVSYFTTSKFGFKCYISSLQARTLLVPSTRSLVVLPPYPSYSDRVNITNNVIAVSNGVSYAVSPMFFSRVSAIYQSCFSLFCDGYRGPGFEVFSSGSYHCVNVNFPTLVSDILSSTNTAWRSSISTALASLNSSLTVINSSLNSINSDYQTVNVNYLDPTSVLQRVAASVSAGGDLMTGNLDSSDLDYIQSLLDSNPSRAPAIASSVSDYFSSRMKDVIAAYVDTRNDPESPAYGRQLSDFSGSNSAQSDLLNFASGRDSMSNISRDVKRLSTNDWVTATTNSLKQNTRDAIAALSNNTESIKRDLASWRSDATNQLAHMFSDDPLGRTPGQNISLISDNTKATADILGSSLNDQNNGLNVTIQNSAIPVSIGIDLSDEFSQINSYLLDQTTSLGALSDVPSIIGSFYSDWYDTWRSDYGLGHLMFRYINNLDGDGLHADLENIRDSLMQTNALDRALDSLTNFLSSIQFTNSVDLSAVLLDDYESFVDSGRFSDLVSRFASYDLGFARDLSSFSWDDTSSSYGRWWNLKTVLDYSNSLSVWSNVMLSASIQSNMMSNFSSVMAAFHSMTSSLPETTEVVSSLLTIKQEAESAFSSFDYVTNSISSFSNAFDRVSVFYHASNLPSRITIFRLTNDIQFTVDTDPLIPAFRLMHSGLAFCYSVVALIFLPKFILVLFNLFFKFFNRFLVLHKTS